MQLIIDRDSGAVTIDGRTHIIDVTSVQPEITRVVWRDDHGQVQYRDGTMKGLGDIERFRFVVDLWNEAQRSQRV
jgi:hypothetical protein